MFESSRIGKHGDGEHWGGDPPVPGGPPTDPVVVQAGEVLPGQRDPCKLRPQSGSYAMARVPR
jgi:hypothetical protein